MISVIVPIYNVELYLKDCLESIKNQTFTDLEVLLIDDCSTDNSFNIANDFIKNYKGKIQFKLIKHKKNMGQSVARNTGLDIAKGEFIGFIDSDDYIDTKMYEILISELNNNKNTGIISCNSYNVFDNKYTKRNDNTIDRIHIFSKDYAKNIFVKKINTSIWNKLYRREVLINTKFKIGKLSEDYSFLCELTETIENKNINILLIPDYLYYYRIRPNSECTSNCEQVYIDSLETINKYLQISRIKKPSLVQEMEDLYLTELCYLLKFISNPQNSKHNLYEYYYKQLFNFKDEQAKKILSSTYYDIYSYIKYFPKNYSSLFKE